LEVPDECLRVIAALLEKSLSETMQLLDQGIFAHGVYKRHVEAGLLD
jgi:hypothetical protein